MVSVLYLISFIVSYKVINTNKMSAFECGFRAIGSIQRSFSVHFFVILVIFVIFDLEIVLLLGVVTTLGFVGSTTFYVVIAFVIGGMYIEWYLGKLKWMV